MPFKPMLLVLAELFEALAVDGDEGLGRRQGLIGAGEDALGDLGAAGGLMIVKEFDDPLDAERTDEVGIGSVLEEDAEGAAFEGLGFDDGDRYGQVGMGLAEALDVDDGAGPDAIELTAEVNATGFEFVCGLTPQRDRLVEGSHLGRR